MKEMRFPIFYSLFSALFLFFAATAFAQEQPVAIDLPSSQELVRQAWEASSQNDFERLNALVNQCVELYGFEAKELQKKLTSLPARGEERSACLVL